jgi:hypothetical protein
MSKETRKSRLRPSLTMPLVRGKLSPKAMGDLAELAFSHKAASLGFGVAKPHGDNERFWRVQVKSTYSSRGPGYRALGHRGNRKPYKANEIDFLVAYIAPIDVWYVIPVDALGPSRAMASIPQEAGWEATSSATVKPGIRWRRGRSR